MKKFALIVAGGQGLRLGEGIPKQFLPLKGSPVLFHTISRFIGLADDIYLVLPESHLKYWEELCFQHGFNIKITLVTGGETRSISVANGLKSIQGEGIVAIHDAVRPVITEDLLTRLYETANLKGNAIPAVASKETLRKVERNKNFAVDRNEFRCIQTPQCFDLKAIKRAYEVHKGGEFTDDASLFESTGAEIYLVEGETTNIKITYREDLLYADSLLDVLKM